MQHFVHIPSLMLRAIDPACCSSSVLALWIIYERLLHLRDSSGIVLGASSRHRIHAGLVLSTCAQGRSFELKAADLFDQTRFMENEVRINLLGFMNTHIAAARQMVKQGTGGRIVGAGSIASYRTSGTLQAHIPIASIALHSSCLQRTSVHMGQPNSPSAASQRLPRKNGRSTAFA
jgi:hypothetical protein